MLVAQVAPLMLTVWGVDTLSMGRGLKQEYFTLTDPLIIIAAALLIAQLVDLQYHRWTYRLGALLIAANAVVSQFEPVKHAYLRKEGPEIWCHLYPYAVRDRALSRSARHCPAAVDALGAVQSRRLSSPGARNCRYASSRSSRRPRVTVSRIKPHATERNASSINPVESTTVGSRGTRPSSK